MTGLIRYALDAADLAKRSVIRVAVILMVISTSMARTDVYTVQAVGDTAKAWQDQTVVRTARPMAHFVCWRVGKI